MSSLHVCRTLLLTLVAASWAQSPLREQLAPIVDLSPTDTIVSVREVAESRILLEVRDSGKARTSTLSVASATKSRILAQARVEGVLGEVIDSVRAAAIYPDSVGRERYRSEFLNSRPLLGATAGLLALEFGLQPKDPATNLGILVLCYPASYIGHKLYAKDRDWTEAHVAGVGYGSTFAYVGTLYGTAGLMGISAESSLRTATFTSLLAYPFGVGLGYRYGERHRTDPGRVHLAHSLATQGAFTGAVLPFVLTDWSRMNDTKSDALFRIDVLSLAAGGFAGHLAGDRLGPDRPVPTGVGLGINTLSSLSAWTGLGIAALSHPESPNAYLGLMLAGNTLGTVAGYRMLVAREETRERATRIGMASSLGMLFGYCVFLVTSPKMDDPVEQIMAYPIAGGWAGYLIGTAATRRDPKHAASRSAFGNWVGDFSVNPLVVPVRSSSGTVWTWPGISATLL